MKLSEDKIRSLAEQIYTLMKQSPKFTVYAQKGALMPLIISIITNDLEFEEKLEVEVAKKLQKFEREIESKNMDYSVLSRRVKEQLLREKGIDPQNYL